MEKDSRSKPSVNPVWLVLGRAFQSLFSVASRVFIRRLVPYPEVVVDHIALRMPRLHRAFDGFRVVHISDLHMGTWMTGARLETIARLINAQSPDIIAITGDFVSYTAELPAKELIAGLRGLRPALASLAVLGNHDYWTDPVKIRSILRETGILEIGNACYSIKRGSHALHFTGVDDVLDRKDDLPKALDETPEDGAAIVLVHEPDFADEIAATRRFDLQLSGHTHGGQIALPLVGSLFFPRGGRKYTRGLYRLNGLAHYTNRGLGTTSLQVRYNCPPEITVFELFSYPSPAEGRKA